MLFRSWADKPAFYWADAFPSQELSEKSKHWYNWTMGRNWTEKEVDIFVAQALYIVRTRETEEYESMMQFLATFYEQLNK